MERAMAKVQSGDGPAAVCVAGASADGLVVVTPVFASGQLQSIRVTINYPFTWITPIRSLVGSMTNVLHGQAQYRWEGAAS